MPPIHFVCRSALFLVSLDRSRFVLSKDTNFAFRTLILGVFSPISRVRVLISQDDVALRTIIVGGSDMSLFYVNAYYVVWLSRNKMKDFFIISRGGFSFLTTTNTLPPYYK